MANKVRASKERGKAAEETWAPGEREALQRKRRKILLDILDIDSDDHAAIDAFWGEHSGPLETSLLRDRFRASKELVLLIVGATLSGHIAPKARLYRAFREAMKEELTTEERRAHLVREIEIERRNFFCQCRKCLRWTSSAKCHCGARTGLDVMSLWGLSELDKRFSTLIPEDGMGADIAEEWVSCTLVAAKLSIKVGAFGDDKRGSPKLKPSERARHVAKLFDLAYRRVFGCAPASHEGFEPPWSSPQG